MELYWGSGSPYAWRVMLGLMFKGPYRGLWIFFAVTPLGAAAAFNLPALGGASILISDLAALTLLGLVLVQTASATIDIILT